MVSLSDQDRNNSNSADDGIAHLRVEVCVGRQKHVHARTELHDAEPLAGLQIGARLHTAHDAPREDADDLPKDYRQAAVINPHLAPFVRRRGIRVICGQEPALAKSDFRDSAGNRAAVDVHIGRRKENADLLPLAGRRGLGIGWSGYEHTAIGRRQHQVRVLRRDAVGIAKEIQEKSGEDQEWHGAEGANGRSRRYRKDCRATDERITCAIDRHATILIPIN
jgi:hypothetical protein